MIQQAWQTFLDAEAAETSDGLRRAGVVWLPELRVASFEGADACQFLQGYLTCDTSTLGPDRLQPTALCSLKGRVVVNGWCRAPTSQQVQLVIHDSLFDELAKLLQVYLRFSKTRLRDRRDDLLVFGGLDLAPAVDGVVIDAARQLFFCNELAAAEQFWRSRPHVAADAWQERLIGDGLPLISAPTSDQYLPQMLNLPELGAINFNKGCYLGQEVVARAQHRGQVKRHLLRLNWQGPARPSPGLELLDADGRPRAVVIQAAGAAGAGTALAVVQDDAALPLQAGAVSFVAAANPQDSASL